MRTTAGIHSGRAKVMLMGSSMFAAMMVIAPSLANAQAVAANGVESVTVTGYAASLLKATEAKRDSANFIDSVFAEDMGKFPDTNIAESLNRIPGVTISREIDGSGVQVSIRGLGTNFTKVTLNNAQIAVASTGGTDGQNANREVDLNMFPTELFTQLTVSKSPTPDMIEGGAAGNVNLRSARPFDQEGFRVTYSASGIDNANAPAMGYRGALIVSDTWGPFGALIGISGVHNRIFTTGWEDGNSGWTNPALSAAQCSQATCNTTGGGNFTIPANVPANVTTGGLVPGHVIDAAYLAQLNPGTSNFQIDNGLIPRLGRSMYEDGHRDRYNGVASFEYRPTDGLHFYLDVIGGRTNNEFDRSDIDWVGRNGSVIPINEKVDANNVVTSGTFANAQFFLEARPYKERADFFSINPGAEWELSDKLHFDLQFNWSRSNFFRDSPTILVNTPLSGGYVAGTPGPAAPVGGVAVTFNNPGTLVPPTITTNIDLNNPANFIWSGGRVNLDEERRITFTKGVHTNLAWGDDHFTLKGGLAFDDVGRTITGLGNSQPWQNATCGDNPSQYLPPPNPQPSCTGLNISGSQASVFTAAPAGSIPNLPGYGTGFSTGFPPLTYSGSLVPQSALASYLRPGPAGFIAVNYPAFKTATLYDQFARGATSGTGSNTGASSGIVEEKNYGAYLQTSGFFDIQDHKLRYNAGVRWVYTNQLIAGPVTIVDPRNSTLAAGGQYPNTIPFAVTKHNYQAFLPSVNMVYEVSDDFQVRAAISRTMTRPNPTTMLPGLNFSDQAAASATLGNPGLKPFFSNNIDLGAEYYTGGAGVFSVAVFRKALSGFTTTQTSTVPFSFLSTYGVQFATLSPTQQQAITLRGGATVATINLAQQVNASGLLTVNGMEFNWVQPLDFLTTDLLGVEGFGFTANLTILDQKGSGSAPAIATGISPYQYNLTGYYDHNGVSFRMSYVFNDKTYASGSNQQGICLPSTANPACPGGAYLYGAAYGQMDISSSLRLSNLFGAIPTDPEVTFDIQNVTDSKLLSYFNFPNAVHSYYNQGQTFMFGLRGTW
jgi:TonB-dependent receptor